MNWMDEIEVTAHPPIQSQPEPVGTTSQPEELRAAAARFEARGAQDKAGICLSMAANLKRYGGYASDKQATFAANLIKWSAETRVRTQAAHSPKTFDLMQRLADLRLPGVKLSRKNADSLVWVMQGENTLAGKLESPGHYTPFYKRVAGPGQAVILEQLRQAEADPLAAAVAYGRLSGRCAVCGHDLTNPISVEAGIGPVCAGRLV